MLIISKYRHGGIEMLTSTSTFARTAIAFTIIIIRKSFHQHCRVFCSRPKPRDVILFPGQGSQFVGMAASLAKMPVVKQLFETANKILGYDLLELCLNGPKAELDRTVYCQPAVFVASLAALEKYKEMQGNGYIMYIGRHR